MAGGQERILRRRIGASSRRRRSRARWSSSPRAGSSRRRHAVAAAAAVQRQITEVVHDLAAAGGAGEQPAAHAAPGDPQGRVHRDRRRPRPVRRVQLVGDPRRRAARSQEQASRAATTRSSLVGRKAEGYFRYREYRIDAAFTGFSRPAHLRGRPADRPPPCTDAFLAGEVDMVELVYTRFVVGRHARKSCSEPLMPLEPRGASPASRRRGDDGRRGAAYEFEPGRRTRSSTLLLPRYVEARVYAALLNAAASEHAARQRAMKAATDNADDLITSLTRVHEPRPPGRDHHRDHGDRGWRRGPARRRRHRRRRSSPTPSKARRRLFARTAPSDRAQEHHDHDRRHRDRRAEGRPRRRDRRPGRRRRVPARRVPEINTRSRSTSSSRARPSRSPPRSRSRSATAACGPSASSRLTPGHEPRPPGRDHDRDHGDRRWCRGPAQRGRHRRRDVRYRDVLGDPRVTDEERKHDHDRRHWPGLWHRAQGRSRRRDRRTGGRRRVPARRAARDQLRARDGRRARGRDDHDHRRGRAADRRRPRAGHLHEADRRPQARHARAQHRPRHHRCRSATACSATCST